MNVEELKNNLYEELEELEQDIVQLQGNLDDFREALEKVKTIEDAEKFDDELDLEYGLQHIRLF